MLDVETTGPDYARHSLVEIGVAAGSVAEGVVGRFEAVLDCVDRLAADIKPAERAAMTRHFVTTSRYEWMFWDMGLRRESWPI